MANREACELWIEQEIESGLEEGKTPYSIGKEISDWVAKMFEVRISPRTIESRAYRQQDNFTSNEVKESQPIKTIANSKSESHLETIKDRHPQGGGARQGAGRPKFDKTKIMSSEYKDAFEIYYRAIKNAKHGKFKDTSKEAILDHLRILGDVVII